MPTLEGDREPLHGKLATHHGGKMPLSERFRRAKLRASMFGDPGETLTIGRYEVTDKIGAGAMGTVYLATDSGLDRDVAVKVLHQANGPDASRMATEAKALGKLSHPNVVTVHEVGTDDGQLFVAMEYVRGKTLNLWLEGRSTQEVLDAFAQAAEGLQAAHDAGIVHRDFKPENVIVGDDGRVRVLDFGLARSLGATLVDEVDPAELEAMDQPALTRTGVLAGTPSYMAPEQFRGGRVDAAADQFAFCIALHESIWGVRPFEGETISDLARNVTSGEAQLAPSRPRRVPASVAKAIEHVVARGLRTDPSKRHASMNALATSLRKASTGGARRGWIKWAAAAFVFGVVALFVGAGLSILRPLPDDRARAKAAQAPAQPDDATLVSPFEAVDAGELRDPFEGTTRIVYVDEDQATAIELLDRARALRDQGIACEAGVCAVSRSWFQTREDQPSVLLSRGSLAPFERGGETIGLELSEVRGGSVPAMVGLQAGDVLTAVNGLALARDLKPGLDLVGQELHKTDALTVEYLREGERGTLSVRVVD